MTAAETSRVDPAEAQAQARRLSGKLLIDGQLQNALAAATLDVVNPATLERIGNTPRCGEADVVRAVDSAVAAFPA